MAFCRYCGNEVPQGGQCTCPESIKNNQNKAAENEPQTFNPYGDVNPTPVNAVQQPPVSGGPSVQPPVTTQGAEKKSPVGQDGKIDLKQIGKDIGISVDTDKVKGNINGVINKINGGNAEQDNNNTFERGKNIVPECINANDGEIPIKQYKFARLRTRYLFAKAEGRLQITNKRILFRATGRSIMGKSTLHQEFEISQIGGVEFRTRYDFNILSLLGGIIVTALAALLGAGPALLISDNAGSTTFAEIMAMLFQVLALGGCIFAAYYFNKIKSLNKYYTVRQILMAPGVGALSVYMVEGNGVDEEFLIAVITFFAIPLLINLFLISFVPDLVAVIKTKGAIPGIEIKKENPQALLAFLFTGRHDDSNSGFMEILPWTDTELAIKEVGTIVDDIQTMGDAAIAKWQVKEY